MSISLLDVENLTMRFGGLFAVDDLSFAAEAARITAIIGPNGAGKTTLFNCVTGFYRPQSGRIVLNHLGRPLRLDHMADHAIASKAGVARTFQKVRLFARMSVLENLIVAQHRRLMPASAFSLAGLLGLASYRKAETGAVDKARFWLDRVGLLDQADDDAGSLAYGAQRKLEIARAMCTDPVLLCLDEPAAGLNPHESAELNRLLVGIRDEFKIGLLLIEHDMNVVMGVSDKVVVLDYGKKIAEGTPDAVRKDPKVIAAYLGQEGD